MTLLITLALSSLLPLAAGIYTWRALNKGLRILLAYFAIAFIYNALLIALGRQGINNLWLIQLFTPVEYTLLMWVLSARCQQRIRRTFRASIPAFIVFWLIDALLFEPAGRFNTISLSLEMVLLVIAASYTLFVINKEAVSSPLQDPFFWIASAALMYFGISVIVYSLSNVFLSISMGMLRTAHVLMTIVDILANVLYAVGFLCFRRRAAKAA